MSEKPSLTVILAAYNEARRLKGAYETATEAVRKAGISDYEILVASVANPDGSHDGTPDIASYIAKKDSKVRSLHTPGYTGMGIKYRQALAAATKDYVIMIPAANHITQDTLVNVFKHMGQASIILTFTKNPEARPFYVRFVSKTFVVLCNLFFGLNMKYFNGITLYPRKLLGRVPMSAESPAYNAEILIYLLKSGIDYIELPQEVDSAIISKPGKTFMLKNIPLSLKTLILLFWKIHFQKKRVTIGKG